MAKRKTSQTSAQHLSEPRGLFSLGQLRLLPTETHNDQDPVREIVTRQGTKHSPCQGIMWPHNSLSASPAVEASRASLSSPGSESAPQSSKRPWLASQGSGLDPQPSQTRILHLGAAVAATFLGDKAVQEALEKAQESCRQSIFSL